MLWYLSLETAYLFDAWISARKTQVQSLSLPLLFTSHTTSPSLIISLHFSYNLSFSHNLSSHLITSPILFSPYIPQILVLVLALVIQIAVGGFFYSLVSDSGIFTEGVWEAWTYMADPGTHADVQYWHQRWIAFIITLIGILFFAVIVGFVVREANRNI